MRSQLWWLLLCVAMTLIALSGCDPGGVGSDALSTQIVEPFDGSDLLCDECHLGSDGINPIVLDTAESGGKHQKHVAELAYRCATCHTNYADQQIHFDDVLNAGDPTVELVRFDARNPDGLWSRDTSEQTGGCRNTNCHGPGWVEWYGSEPLFFPPCGACHGGTMTARRKVLGSGGDFAGNPAIASHHVAGDSPPSPEQCKVCHDQSRHMGGTVRLRHADGRAGITYDAARPGSLEPFCLSCHDANGATASFTPGGSALDPFNTSISLGAPPYSFGASIAASWSKAYGHGPNGHHKPGDRLTCTDCHGSAAAVNAHGSTGEVLAAEAFNYSLALDRYEAADYALCFNCHADYPGVTKEDTLGVKAGGLLDGAYGPAGPNGNNPPYYTSGVTTQFSDHIEAGDPFGLNDPAFWGPPDMNLHWFHLGILGSDFRGSGTTSAIVCVNCHDVHGSDTPHGAVHDALGYTSATDASGNRWGEMTLDLGLLGNHPTYCGFNCHTIQGPTRAWFDPISE